MLLIVSIICKPVFWSNYFLDVVFKIISKFTHKDMFILLRPEHDIAFSFPSYHQRLFHLCPFSISEKYFKTDLIINNTKHIFFSYKLCSPSLCAFCYQDSHLYPAIFIILFWYVNFVILLKVLSQFDLCVLFLQVICFTAYKCYFLILFKGLRQKLIKEMRNLSSITPVLMSFQLNLKINSIKSY